MTSVKEYPVTSTSTSKLKDIILKNIAFGKYFTDHMLTATYENGSWTQVKIVPFDNISISPSLSALHYGQSIFEGIKAYRSEKDGTVAIFRPHDNFKRFNTSAERMQMPTIPEDIFIDGMKQLVNIDSNWVPSEFDHSLYIRPFMFATDTAIGVKPSDTYRFMIILSPAGPYYNEAIRIHVEENYVRAARGGVGYAKAAGNYGGAMYPTAQAKAKGYDQVLWTDAYQHKFVQECGTMNVFFVNDNQVYTPDLTQGTILDGVTRDSVLTLLTDMGYTAEARAISIDEIADWYNKGTLTEVFGTGTAATVTQVKELGHEGTPMFFDTDTPGLATKVKSALNDIRYGKVDDKYKWMEPVS